MFDWSLRNFKLKETKKFLRHFTTLNRVFQFETFPSDADLNIQIQPSCLITLTDLFLFFSNFSRSFSLKTFWLPVEQWLKAFLFGLSENFFILSFLEMAWGNFCVHCYRFYFFCAFLRTLEKLSMTSKLKGKEIPKRSIEMEYENTLKLSIILA